MQYGGDWDGSNVHMDHIEFLRKTRRLPGADQVWVRLAPVKEITPESDARFGNGKQNKYDTGLR